MWTDKLAFLLPLFRSFVFYLSWETFEFDYFYVV